MTSETVLLIVQPLKYSGKVNGAKGLIRNWLQALTAGVITLYWGTSKNSLYFTIFWSMIFGLFVTFGMIYMCSYYEIESNDYNEKRSKEINIKQQDSNDIDIDS